MPLEPLRVEEKIAATPDELYALVSDVTRTGEWSPENIGGRWIGSADAPVVGAKFRGSNRRGFRRWSTTCTVVTADPGKEFAFEVGFYGIPVARWGYEFAPAGDGTLVTETWNDRRPRWFALAAGPVMGLSDVRTHTEQNMRTTLARLGEAAVQASQPS